VAPRGRAPLLAAASEIGGRGLVRRTNGRRGPRVPERWVAAYAPVSAAIAARRATVLMLRAVPARAAGIFSFDVPMPVG